MYRIAGIVSSDEILLTIVPVIVYSAVLVDERAHHNEQGEGMKFIETVFSLKVLRFIVRLRQELKLHQFRREMTKKQLEQILIDLAINAGCMKASDGREDRYEVSTNLGFTTSADDHGRQEIITALLVLERDGCIESGDDLKVTEQGKAMFATLEHIPCRGAIEKVVAKALERITKEVTRAREKSKKKEEDSAKPSIKQMRLFIPKHRRNGRSKPRDMDT